jgi:hypothetical protein
MIDKALLSKLMLIFSVAISMIAVYMFISPYQNCKRDMVGSFEDAYGEASTWSEKSSLIKQCSDTTKW